MIWTLFALFVTLFLTGLFLIVWWTTDGLSGLWDET